MNNGARLLVACCAIALLCGCAPFVGQWTAPAVSTAEVTEMLAAPLRQVTSLQASGTLKVSDRGAPLLADIFLVFDRAQGLRLDVVTPFGTPLFTAIVGLDEILLLDYRHTVIRRGPADAATAWKALRIEVEPRFLRQFVAGGLALDPPAWDPVKPERGEDRDLWHFQAADWRVGIEPRGRRPATLRLERPEPLTVAWKAVRPEDGVPVPHEISIARPAQKQTLVLKMADVRVNQLIETSLFHPSVPDGWRVQEFESAN